VAGAIRLIAHAEAALVFGCWAGKDRTGIVAALTLSLLGVSDQWIAADFAQTGPSLLPAKDRFAFLAKDRFAALWKDQPNAEAAIIQAHLATEPETVLGFLSDVRQQFGSVSRALELPDSIQAALLERYVGVG
jgi:protein-tyrosine phosphatase